MIFKCLTSTNGIEEIHVESCQSKNDVDDLFKSSSFNKDFCNRENIKIINFEYADNVSDFTSSELENSAQKFIDQSVIIVINSKKDGNFMIYWTLKGHQLLLSLILNRNLDLSEKQKLREFIVDFLIESLKIGHLGESKIIKQLFKIKYGHS